ncbi:zinc finger protein Xfin-like isoform X2 [Oppia nitens]|uniref:zinc finger protein Xfin-like isoform X2 n=1 Tax=Oppia nitens TaxID=1686743 RepID=UPI0023DC4E47|nr:zinc finger protein Xfin-like isoform X2 [Oppia nitens]
MNVNHKRATVNNNHHMIGHKNIEDYIEKNQIDGKIWYRCLWMGCDYTTNRSDSIHRHLRKHTGIRPYRCSFEGCTYATIQSSALKIHIRRHTGEKPYKCQYPGCGKRFTVLGTLLIHERTHTGHKPFKCDECSYACIERSKLSIHLKKTHGIIRPTIHNSPNRCTSSSYFKTTQLVPINLFNAFATTATEDIQVDVDVPDVGSDKSSSIDHMNEVALVENSIKNIAQYVERREIDGKIIYYCRYSPECKYDSMRSDCIVRHMRCHTGDKPYKCHYEGCDYKTVQRSALNEHLMWHTGQRYKCEFCNYKSIKRTKLRQHIQKNHLNSCSITIDPHIDPKHMKELIKKRNMNWFEYTGEKPYKCQYHNCGYQAVQKSSLKKHETKHTTHL